MFIGSKLIEFLLCLGQVRSDADFYDLMLETTRRLGFEQFAFVSHVDLVAAAHEAVAISNYPEGWVERIMTERYYLDDPVHAASIGRSTPYAWHSISDDIIQSKRQRTILTEGASFGLQDGITVPVHSPGEYRGTCSFATSQPVTMTPQIRGATHVVAGFGFEAARKLVHVRLGIEQSAPTLPRFSPREVDCVGLVASGMGDAQIAHALGLSEATVHQHVTGAMRKCGVFKRTALVFRALFDGHICFHSVRRTSSK